MKPYVICHMGSSIEGRIVPRHWPKSSQSFLGEVYERLHQEFKADAWIVGRVTMAEFAKGEPKPVAEVETFPRVTWKNPAAQHGPYAVALDQGGKLHLNTDRVNGDALVAILTEQVSDEHLAELRRDGISYIFAGEKKLDLSLALDLLNRDFGISRLLLEGGGGINGSFLEAGPIDEISLLLMPIADGHADMPTTFDGVTRPSQVLSLLSVDRLENDLLHLRYAVK